MAISVAQFAFAENGGSSLTASFTATLTGDYIVCIGEWDSSKTLSSFVTSQGDNFTLLPLSGTTSPISNSLAGAPADYFVAMVKPTTGSTSVVMTFSGATSFCDLGVYVVRDATNLSLDQSLGISVSSASTVNQSGVTGTLITPIELAVGYCITLSGMSGVNTAQTGSSGFTSDQIGGNDCCWSHQITSSTSPVNAAYTVTSGTGEVLCCTFYDQLSSFNRGYIIG